MMESGKLFVLLCAMCLLGHNGASGKESESAVEEDLIVPVGYKLKCFSLSGSNSTISSENNNKIPAAMESCQKCCSDHHHLISSLTSAGNCYCNDAQTAEQMPKDETMIRNGYKLKCFSLPGNNLDTAVKNCNECCSNNHYPMSIVINGTDCYCNEGNRP